MKKLTSLVLALTLCASLALPALAAEGEKISADTGAISEPTQETTGKAETAPASALDSAPETGQPVISFTDVPENHTFYAAVMDCAAKGIASGYDDGTFKPANSVTKAQFCVMLARAFYPLQVEDLSTDENKAVAWYNPSIMALRNAGVLTNVAFADSTDNTIVMGQAIPRYQMAQLMTNIMSAKGFSATAAQKTEAQEKILDYENTYTGYQDAVANVYALGIITGYSDGAFHGHDIMNRGQGCVVIYRMAQYTPTTSEPVTSDTDGGTPIPPAPKPETPATPAQPETPTVQTLVNGKPITEDNVLALLDELKAKYPSDTNFGAGYTNLDTTGDVYKAIGRRISVRRGCGAWAALVSDYIFGQAGAPMRKVDFKSARPGDILVSLRPDGTVKHVLAITSKPYHDNDMAAWCVDTTESTTAVKTDISTYFITWSKDFNGAGAMVYDDGYGANTKEVWTRYPT